MLLEGTVCILGINLKAQTEFDTSGGHHILGKSYSSKVRTFTLFDNHTSSRRLSTGHFTAVVEELLQLGNQVFSDSLLIAQETNQSSKKKIEQQKKANTNTKVVCIMTWADNTRQQNTF